MNKIIHLKNAILECGILPECGGSLSYLKFFGKDGKEFHVLRPAHASAFDRKDANGMSLFPLVPYSNRIRKGKFVYWGILRKVPKNKTGCADPIHGDGWVSTWSAQNKTETSITLKLVHDKDKGGFPFSYESFVTYTLEDNTFKVDVEIKNTSTLPMPCGMGIHPYFPKSSLVEVQFKSKVVWAHELDTLINGPYKTPEKWNFDTQKPLGNLEMDTCFGGNDGSSKIFYPKTGLTVEMKGYPDFSHLVLYAPRNKSFFALEHVTNANDAFNLATNSVIGTGIKSIGPNETIKETIELSICQQ
ncbi:MAG: hypothetical protein EOM53_00715 [Alphaproteobacteria bacterium]|nr:hypothetical protein [Alphaproteobacteria bacterium]